MIGIGDKKLEVQVKELMLGFSKKYRLV